ncbi:hypothetical protein G6011_11816 [Alternaria panax]|uniref:Heterokaryon incompatibility domain-containing protein n=1 Tax=Alternaria panax TaxID=48097 RepID=A0AAD4F8G1_9PLEO|nr:hypothetical protein G6011_11816 [Alternaria panax]
MANTQETQQMRRIVSIEIQESNSSWRAIGRTSEDFVTPGQDWAQWPTELLRTRRHWFEAFKGMPIPGVKGKPSRLLDVKTGEVVSPDEPVQYAAVSYVWRQWEGKLHEMLRRLKDAMEPTGLSLAWIDQKCIIQTSDIDKGAEIERMGQYYDEAAVTFVMVPEWSSTFIWELAGFVMNKAQATKARAEVEALENTMWMSRVWTGQEALLSRRTVFVGECEIKSAVELSIASRLDKVLGSACENVHATWNLTPAGVNTVRVKSENNTLGALNVNASVNATSFLRDEQILTNMAWARKSHKYLDEVWRTLRQRECSLKEDRVYGMLGLLNNAGKFAITPKIGFEEAVRRAADEGLVSSEILLAEVSSQEEGRSWCPQPGTESRIGYSARRIRGTDTEHKWIELTPEGLCKVQGVRIKIPERPEEFRGKTYNSLYCKNLEGGDRFSLSFDHNLPKGDTWRGKWLAVFDMGEGGLQSFRATLIQYENLKKGVLRKL